MRDDEVYFLLHPLHSRIHKQLKQFLFVLGCFQ